MTALRITGTDVDGNPVTEHITLPERRWPGYDATAKRFRDARGRFCKSPWRRVTRIVAADQ